MFRSKFVIQYPPNPCPTSQLTTITERQGGGSISNRTMSTTTAIKSYSHASASSRRWMLVSMGLLLLLLIQYVSMTPRGDCLVSFGTYKGHQYTTKETTGSKCLVESKWMRVQQHQVQFSGQSSTISDWLWIDYHDRINVLVEAPSMASNSNNNNNDERQFYVFDQSKYALEGRTSMAIIGGIIEPGESPERAAAREVEEEMHVTCNQMHWLGRFRTDVNRGMGWVNSYLATQCQPAKRSKGGEDGEDQVGTADVERQDLRRISLAELIANVRNGDFVEVQWSNTVALALLHPELVSKSM